MFESTIATARSALDSPRAPSVEGLLELVRLADAVNAAAVLMASQVVREGTIEGATGLTPESALRLQARRTRWDAAELVRAAEALEAMPKTREALGRGIISFSQARAIVRECKDLSHVALAEVDALVGEQAPGLCDAEPEELVWRVEEAVARLRAQAELRREDRAISGSFLWLQGRLDGGGAVYGHADAERFATIAEALEAACARLDADLPRAGQRMDALVGICESSLAGGSTGARPRPRLLASVELAELERLGMAKGARLLAPLAGRPLRLSPLGTEVLSCDAEVQVVAFDGAQPVAISTVRKTVPDKLRAAIVARDGACRFPTCPAPAAWSECHHIRWRSAQGTDQPTNLVLLCRRHHRLMHRSRWRITHRSDGSIEFRHRGKTYLSMPRARAPSRE